MLASLLIVFREVLEAGLVLGIVLAATQGVAARKKWIAGGIAAGLAGAGLLAAFAGEVASMLDGNGQEIFTASVLCFAVVMLGWHNIAMASHGRAMVQDLRSLGRSVSAGKASMMTMAAVVAVAFLREGAEVVLFLYGIALSGHEGAGSLIAGIAGGLIGGAGVAWVMFRGLLIIPAKNLFAVTNGLVALLAAGMAGQAAAILAGIGLVPTLGDQLWDTSAILRDDSIPGRALRALIGYSDRPPGIQVLAFVVTLSVFLVAARLFQSPERPKRVAALS